MEKEKDIPDHLNDKLKHMNINNTNKSDYCDLDENHINIKDSTLVDVEQEISADAYFEFESHLKEALTVNLDKHLKLSYSQLNENERKFVNKDCASKVPWVFNVNSVYGYRGDLSTNSMQKFYHLVFKDFDDGLTKHKVDHNELEDSNKQLPETLNVISSSQQSSVDSNNNEFTKFKQSFIDTFNSTFVSSLTGENLIHNKFNLNDYIAKFEFKNGFLNVFLKGLGKNLIEKIKKKNDKKKKTSENEFMFTSIGEIQSCFPEKFSVPRQGNLLSLTRAKIIINKNINMSAFDGIENFDYIWIVYVFHLNTEFSKAKISPPKYEGNKLGIFATRSPHRPNPIGLTLAKIEKIEKNEILISSVDMISGTPVIDIKPYHHLEAVDMQTAKYPQWIKTQAEENTNAKVVFTDNAVTSLKNILEKCKLLFYDNFDDLLKLIKGVLEIDPHSKYTRKKKDTMVYAFYVDKLNVIYEYNSQNKEVLVTNIEYSEEYKKLRNKSWLENYNKNNI